MAERILILAAHIIDETFVLGEFMRTLAARCDEVSIVMFSDDVNNVGLAAGGILDRHRKCRLVCRDFGTENVWMHRYARGNMPMDVVTNHIGTHYDRFNPTLIYTHGPGDENADHALLRTSAELALAQRALTVPVNTFYGLCSKVCGQ